MTTNLLLFAAFVAVMLLLSFNHTKKKKKILFFGDSITEQGSQPSGFLTKLRAYLKNEGLENKYDVIGSGRSGNKIYDLFLRLDSDVIAQSADIVVVLIGFNDVLHKQLYGTGTDADRFEAFYENLVTRLKSAKAEVILCTLPAIIYASGMIDETDAELHRFSEIIINVAATNNLRLIDLRKEFLHYNMENPENQPAGISVNGSVQMNEGGHLLMAREIWSVLFESRP